MFEPLSLSTVVEWDAHLEATTVRNGKLRLCNDR